MSEPQELQLEGLEDFIASVSQEQNDTTQLQQSQVDADEEQNRRAEEIISSLQDSKIVDTTSSSAFKKGFDESESLIGKAFLAQASVNPVIGEILMALPQTSAWISSTGKEAFKKLSGSEGFENLNPMEKFKAISDKKKEMIAEYYADVLPENGYETAGNFARALLDPTTVLPAGQTFKAGAAIGGLTLGVDTALEQKFNEGELDAQGIAISTAFGGLLGGTIARGGKMFSDWLGSRVAERLPVEEGEVKSILLNAKVDPADFNVQKLTSEINEKFKLSESSVLESAVKASNQLLNGNFQETLPVEEIIGRMSRESSLGLVEKSETYAALNKIANIDLSLPDSISVPSQTRVGRSQGRSTFTVQGGKYEIDPEMALEVHRNAYNTLSELESAIPLTPEGTPSKELIKALGGIEGKIEDSANPTVAAMKTIVEGDIPWKNSLAGPKIYTEIGRMRGDFMEFTPEEAEKLISGRIDKNLWTKPETFLRKLGAGGREISERMRRAFEDTHMSVGDKLKTVEIAVKDAVKASKGASKDSINNDIVRAIRDPEFKRNAPRHIVEAATKIRSVFNKTVDDYVKVGLIDSEHGTLLKADLTYFPRVYDNVLLSTEEGKQAFIAKLTGHNWTPEQLDRALKSLPLTSAEKTASAVTGKKFTRVQGIVKGEDGNYRVSRGLANRLLDARGLRSTKKLSHHMEKDRKLDLPDEVIEDFLISDPSSVAERYLTDAYKRLSFSKYFGKDGEVINKYVVALNTATGRNELSKYVKSIYDHAIGNPEDEKVAAAIAFMSRPSLRKSIVAGLNSVETLKLTLAPIANMAQATVAGSILLTRNVGFYGALKTYTKGLSKTVFDYSNSKELAERSGAAIEQTIMQANADLGMNYQRWTNKYLKGIGFVAAERIQRTLAYNLGKANTEALLSQKDTLLKTIAKQGPGKDLVKKLNKLNKTLDEYGIDSTINNIGNIPVAEMERAAQRFSNMVNFVRDADQLPLWAQSPYASLFTKFKTFSYWWGSFLYKNVYEPALEGNLKPLITFAAVGGAAGSGIGYGKEKGKEGLGILTSAVTGMSKVKSKKKKEGFLRNWANNLALVGGLGLASDIMRTSVEYGPGMAFGSVLGPGITDSVKSGTDLLKASGDLFKGDVKEAGKKVIKSTSYFAPPVVSNMIRQSVGKSAGKTTRTRNYQSRGLRDYQSDD